MTATICHYQGADVQLNRDGKVIGAWRGGRRLVVVLTEGPKYTTALDVGTLETLQIPADDRRHLKPCEDARPRFVARRLKARAKILRRAMKQPFNRQSFERAVAALEAA